MLTGQPRCQDTPLIRVRAAALSALTLDSKAGKGSVAVAVAGVVAGWAGDGAAEAAAGGADVVTAGADDGVAVVAELPPPAQPAARRAAVSPAAATAVILVIGRAAKPPGTRSRKSAALS
jgi:hypothetical protein